MTRYYGKKKRLPRNCPGCGQVRKDDPDLRSPQSYMNWCMGAFTGFLDRSRPGWGVHSWATSCGTCAFRKALQDSGMLTYLELPLETQGREFHRIKY
jgi:hypothetical protein